MTTDQVELTVEHSLYQLFRDRRKLSHEFWNATKLLCWQMMFQDWISAGEETPFLTILASGSRTKSAALRAAVERGDLHVLANCQPPESTTWLGVVPEFLPELQLSLADLRRAEQHGWFSSGFYDDQKSGPNPDPLGLAELNAWLKQISRFPVLDIFLGSFPQIVTTADSIGFQGLPATEDSIIMTKDLDPRSIERILSAYAEKASFYIVIAINSALIIRGNLEILAAALGDHFTPPILSTMMHYLEPNAISVSSTLVVEVTFDALNFNPWDEFRRQFPDGTYSSGLVLDWLDPDLFRRIRDITVVSHNVDGRQVITGPERLAREDWSAWIAGMPVGPFSPWDRIKALLYPELIALSGGAKQAVIMALLKNCLAQSDDLPTPPLHVG